MTLINSKFSVHKVKLFPIISVMTDTKWTLQQKHSFVQNHNFYFEYKDFWIKFLQLFQHVLGSVCNAFVNGVALLGILVNWFNFFFLVISTSWTVLHHGRWQVPLLELTPRCHYGQSADMSWKAPHISSVDFLGYSTLSWVCRSSVSLLKQLSDIVVP